ncbi:MAG: hypothetical protein IJ710_07190 [Prevotella sp.]|nr:hypothetical protein [Prevotella sp.]
MKKFTLLFAAALVALSASAQPGKRIVRESKVQKHTTLVNSVVAKNSSFSEAKPAQPQKLQKAAKGASRVAPTGAATHVYFPEIVVHNDSWGGFYSAYMQEGNVAIEGNQLYLDAYDLEEYIVGTITTTAGEYDGSVVVTFANNQDIIGGAYTIAALEGTGTGSYAYETLGKSAASTFRGLYWPASGEFYLVDIIGVFQSGSTTPLTGYAIADIDIFVDEDAASYEEYFKRGSVAGKSAPDTQNGPLTDFAHEVYGFIMTVQTSTGTETRYYLNGIDPFEPDTWTLWTAETNALTGAVLGLEPELGTYIGTWSWNSYGRGDVMAAGWNPDTGSFGFSNAPYLFAETSADGTTQTFVEDEADEYIYTDIIKFSAGYSLGDYLRDFTITFNLDQSATGIKGVSTNANAVATEYFDLQGRRVDAQTKGLVIVKTHYADGTVKTVKAIR